MDFLSVYKKATHIAAVAVIAAGAFALSPAGQALVAQYPKLATVSAVLVFLTSLYHQPKNQ